MKARGATQDDIDGLVAHSKLSYEDQLKGRISSNSTPSENLVSLVDGGLFYCELKRGSLKIPISFDYTMKTQRELVECISNTSRIISSYYYQSYIPSSSTDVVKAAVDEAYLKWESYTDTIFKNAAPYQQEQAALSVKDQLRRAQQVFLREALKSKK
ncbi:hypothetical protein DNK10_09680 [Pseudomonas daroniae]|nr:hypothetical protein DNK10_09680 [Pseudomonas daroniae]